MEKADLDNLKELVKLGFSKREANLYLLIVRTGPISTKDLAMEMKVSPNSLYRSLNKLFLEKLITLVNDWPKTYKAISPQFAFELLIKNKIILFEESKQKLLNHLSEPRINDQTKIEIIGGTRELFDKYVALSRKTKKEILIISIGEEVPDEVLLANRDSIERGVKVLFIAHKHDQTNHHLLIRWQRMGLEVKHLPGEGFHLVIFDQNQCLLSASDPKNPKERTTILIFSQAISKAMTDYFYSLWKEAVKLG